VTRIPRMPPESLDEEQRRLYDLIADGPRAAGPQLFELVGADRALNGPFNAMLLAPSVGVALQGLGSSIRHATGLSGRTRETAILAVAAHHDSAFERYAHEPVGKVAGLTESELALLRRGEDPEFDDVGERAAFRLVRALLSGSALDENTFATIRSEIGDRALFELSTLVGYYSLLAQQLRLFEVGVPRAGTDGSRSS